MRFVSIVVETEAVWKYHLIFTYNIKHNVNILFVDPNHIVMSSTTDAPLVLSYQLSAKSFLMRVPQTMC